MQFTFIFLYLFYYLLTLWLFLTILILFLPLFFYSKYSFNIIFSFIKAYTSWSYLLYICFFLLVGLPPVGLFFLKLNFIIYLLNYYFIFFAIYIFFFFFFNMLFYIVVFKYHINWNILSALVVDNMLISLYSYSKVDNYFNSNLILIQNGWNKLYYNIFFLIFFLIFFFFFNIFFFNDTYIIIFNLLN